MGNVQAQSKKQIQELSKTRVELDAQMVILEKRVKDSKTAIETAVKLGRRDDLPNLKKKLVRALKARDRTRKFVDNNEMQKDGIEGVTGMRDASQSMQRTTRLMERQIALTNPAATAAAAMSMQAATERMDMTMETLDDAMGDAEDDGAENVEAEAFMASVVDTNALEHSQSMAMAPTSKSPSAVKQPASAEDEAEAWMRLLDDEETKP